MGCNFIKELNMRKAILLNYITCMCKRTDKNTENKNKKNILHPATSLSNSPPHVCLSPLESWVESPVHFSLLLSVKLL